MLSFLRDLSKTLNKNHVNRVSIFTHNGILRCLIGNFFQIERKDWFKIFIPIVIPRNHKVEEVLSEANQNNFEPLERLLEILKKPYNNQSDILDYQIPSSSYKKYQTFCGT